MCTLCFTLVTTSFHWYKTQYRVEYRIGNLDRFQNLFHILRRIILHPNFISVHDHGFGDKTENYSATKHFTTVQSIPI